MGLRLFVNPSPAVKIFVCLLISAYGFFLRIQRFAGRELWNDELYQLDHMVGPFKPVWQRLSYGDFTCFPGDYLLCYPFLRFSGLYQITQSFPHLAGAQKWALVLPHILVTVIGFVALYHLCNRYYKTLGGYIIAFLVVSFNNNLVFHAFEFRPYAVLPVLAVAVLYFAELMMIEFSRWGRGEKFFLGLFFISVILFHMYGIFIVSLCLTFAAAGYRGTASRNDLRKILVFLGCVYLIALPVWFWYLSGKPAVVSARNVFEYIPHPLINPLGFVKAIVGNLVGYKKNYVFLTAFLGWFMVPRDIQKQQVYFLFLLIILPIGIIFVLDILKSYMFLQRQFIWVMPLFAVFLGWVADAAISERFRKKQKLL